MRGGRVLSVVGRAFGMLEGGRGRRPMRTMWGGVWRIRGRAWWARLRTRRLGLGMMTMILIPVTGMKQARRSVTGAIERGYSFIRSRGEVVV